jgi:hypothetical protein
VHQDLGRRSSSSLKTLPSLARTTNNIKLSSARHFTIKAQLAIRNHNPRPLSSSSYGKSTATRAQEWKMAALQGWNEREIGPSMNPKPIDVGVEAMQAMIIVGSGVGKTKREVGEVVSG